METEMIAAHKRGIADYKERADIPADSLIRHARRLYDTENEREAYLAGYIGAGRRAEKKGV